jgi:DNA-binding NarL/FixJ family response regulator
MIPVCVTIHQTFNINNIHILSLSYSFTNKIRDKRFDAIITDHKLNEENSNISFNGLELVKEILDKTPQFPCFILTSFDSEAVKTI